MIETQHSFFVHTSITTAMFFGPLYQPRSATRETSIEPELVRAQLKRLLASRTFAHMTRMSGVLEFVVEQTVEGPKCELSEHDLAVNVFRREPTFDPRLDSVVRVTMRRLRKVLEDYYEGEGRNDTLVIELRTGSYVPRFLLREPTLL